MAKKRVFLGLILSMCFTVGVSAQDTKNESTDKPAKVEKQDKGKKKGADRQKTRTTKTITKFFAKADLTEDQNKKITELVDAHWDDLKSLQDEMNGMITKEDRKKRLEATKKARKDGKSAKEAAQAGFESIGLSEEDQKEFKALNQKRNDMIAEIKSEVRESFSDEQKKAMPAKKKKGKKSDEKKSDKKTVSLKLPGMT